MIVTLMKEWKIDCSRADRNLKAKQKDNWTAAWKES